MDNLISVLFYTFIVISPFFSGLYFEKDFTYAFLYLSLILFLYIIKFIVDKIKNKIKIKKENKNKNEKQKVTVKQKVKTYDNKIIKRLIILGLLILLISNSTYFINNYYYGEEIDYQLLLNGNIQLLEMILFSIICAIRFKHERIKDKENKKENNQKDEIVRFDLAVVISSICMGLLLFSKNFYREGRFEATFYYANATAMFFLISFIMLVHIKTKTKLQKVIKVLVMILDLSALILTNSRFTYILLVLYLGLYVLKLIIDKIKNKKLLEKENNKSNKKIYILIISLISLLLVSLLVIFVMNNDKLINRFKIDTIERDIKLRYSYLVEANDIIKDYPFGLGYEGYLKHNVIKENKYKLRLVHNVPYQIVLNYGFIMLALSLIYFARYIYICARNKKLLSYENVIILLVLLHSLIDIDMSFLVIPNILIMLAVRNLYPEK
ncbi:MAG: O-antigen ligase family protein [Clostridia bacterium]|nr:O-antigen ligase family protein [Clostridia bacterium]